MIILDTNVISEPLRPRCSEAVTAWLDAQAAETLYITAINAAELWAGIALLPHGFLVATRDTRPFRAAGIAVMNPWEDNLGM